MKNNFYFLCTLILFTSSCYSHKVLETSDKETYLEVEQAINNYFTGRKTANIQLLQNTFHSESRLMTMDTTLVLISRDEYLDVVQKKGTVSCKTTLLYVTVDGHRAFAKTKFDYGDRIYEDYLVLIFIKNKWWIVHKTFELK